MWVSLIFAGLSTGLMLGVLGSGGSIVTLPALLYLLDVDPKAAIAMSLGIVAVTALVSALQHWFRGNVDLKITAVFGSFGIVGTYAGARLGVVTPVLIQLAVFALVMYLAAWRMLRPKRPFRSVGAAAVGEGPGPGGARLRYGHIAVHGIVVGLLTGAVGVGGGFLIVPALVLLSRLPMKQAVGTSLSIIAVKSFAGFAGYAGAVVIDYWLVTVFSVIAVAGSMAGTVIGHRLSGEKLSLGFGIFLILVATYILVENVGRAIV